MAADRRPAGASAGRACRDPRSAAVIGIGTGDPAHLSVAAVEALRGCDFVLAVSKRDDDPLLEVRRRLCETYDVPLVVVPDPSRDRDDPADYPGAVRDWHAARVEAFAAVLADRPGRVGFLVWGDPAFYDSTLRLADDLGLEVEVQPGISAPQLLAARHGIVLHEVGRTMLLTTGRRLAGDVADHDNLLVMLDGRLACLVLPDPQCWQVWWGANLGTDSERLVAGRLDEVAPELREAREQAAAEAGWVMDTYLLRRTPVTT